MIKLARSIWSSGSKPLFLRWVLMQVVIVAVSLVAALQWGGHVHGLALLCIPYVAMIYSYAAAHVGHLLLRWDDGQMYPKDKGRIARLIDHAEECMYAGILFCVAGFVITLGSTGAANHTRADALIGTFVGITASRLLAFQHRWLTRLHDYVFD